MAPPAAIALPTTDAAPNVETSINLKSSNASKASNESRLDGPLKYSGSLDQYTSFDVTPVIGREFADVQLTDILNDDAKIRDLAIVGKRSIYTGYRNSHLYV
jgi:hypothetical protein